MLPDPKTEGFLKYRKILMYIRKHVLKSIIIWI